MLRWRHTIGGLRMVAHNCQIELIGIMDKHIKEIEEYLGSKLENHIEFLIGKEKSRKIFKGAKIKLIVIGNT